MTAYLQHFHLSTGNLQPLSFQPRTLYQYRYTLDVQLDHTSTPSLWGARLQAEALIHLHRLWRDRGGEELLQVQVGGMVQPSQLGIPAGNTPGAASPSLSSPCQLKNDLSDQIHRLQVKYTPPLEQTRLVTSFCHLLLL